MHSFRRGVYLVLGAYLVYITVSQPVYWCKYEAAGLNGLESCEPNTHPSPDVGQK